jgi:hypothetical protein
VLRISTNDDSPESSEDEIYDLTFESEVSPKDQMKKCSKSKFKRLPAEGGGVISINLPLQASGLFAGRLVNEATTKALKHFGRQADIPDLQSLADFVMYVLPPGTKGDWSAYAPVYGKTSVYNDKLVRKDQHHLQLACNALGQHQRPQD